MNIKQIQLEKLEIPFRVAFKHAAAERNITETVIAAAHAENGITGYGEGCPRDYVSGESIESCLAFMANQHQNIIQINSVDSLQTFVSTHSLAIDNNPAAWCAIETAILDLLGKITQKSIETLLGLPEIQGSFQYTAVLGVSAPKIFQAQLAQYLQLGFQDFKLKISGDVEIDKANIKSIRTTLPTAKIRLDANNIWHDTEEAITYLSKLTPDFWAVEEPIQSYDYNGLKILAERLHCQIILDESFLQIADFKYLLEDLKLWIPNIRISKMGGLLRSLAIAEACKKNGIPFIIGAQVGETSILTRVAMSLANAYRNMLIAQEGGYGTYLLQHDVIDNSIMFGKNGVIQMPLNNSYGLGLNLNY